jgi:hypothetical protein
MAITIRNKQTEAMIRELGKRWNEGPSETIRRLAARELSRPARSAEEIDRDTRAFEELAKKYPPPDDGRTWADIEVEMQALFDYLDAEDRQDDHESA